MLNDPLSNVLSGVMNAEKAGKIEVAIKPVSKVVKKVLEIMKDNNYVGECKEVEDGRGNFLTLNLLGNINKCGAIKPRFPVSNRGFEAFEKQFLPAQGFGILILSTPKGIMTNNEAKKKDIGGRLLAYCY